MPGYGVLAGVVIRAIVPVVVGLRTRCRVGPGVEARPGREPEISSMYIFPLYSLIPAAICRTCKTSVASTLAFKDELAVT